MPLVGQVGETDVAGQLPADDVAHICGGLGDGLGVLGAHGLRIPLSAHGVATLHKGRGRLVRRRGGGARLVGGRRGGAIGGGS